MKLIPIIADVWKMDGGVAFGVVPKSIWQKIYPADENNMLDIVNRCLLIDFGEQRILIDAGMGRKQSNKYYQHRGVNPHVTLEKALAAAGYSHQDITDVLLTHLHDDHVGGVTVYNSSGKAEPLFPNATFWCSKTQWEWAIHPNKREGASYFPDNLLPLLNSGRLKFIESEGEFLTGINIRMINGHTIGHILPLIGTRNGTIVYMGDFIATAANIPIPYIPAVDIQPLVSMDEKSRFLEEAIQKKYILFFEHDYFNECCTVIETPKGFSAGDKFRLAELTGISI
ncbi:MAG TPA: MBL fold metallo-hydrolase [Bacteroidales bacterium]|jgi:glyoxylase-like metal-dependent hydrolase (beta-lactamase superfamily II)|nr:MBL fold metallo-hydrolase [Bacteroidales bacterium]